MSDINLAQPPGGPPKPPGGIGLPKSPIGGPSGPGGSPMVSPGTGAGMQARAKQQLGRIVENLMALGKDFGAGSPEFKGVVDAIRALNSVLTKATAPEAPKTPLPVPATPPGAGLGGLPGGPPTGLPTGGPGGAGGAAPIAPVG